MPMSASEFDSLVYLIEQIVHYESEAAEHPNDRPRMERLIREWKEMIDQVREELVL